jgi:hypothetical protein
LYRYIYNFGTIKYSVYIKHSVILKTYVDGSILKRIADLNIQDLHTVNIFLSIGLVFKKSIVSNCGFRSFADTINSGIDMYQKYIVDNKYIDSISNIDDKSVLMYYLHIIENILKGNIKKWYLIKDTTASITQHTGKLLGFTKKSLKYVNLSSSNSYYDTYELYVNELIIYLKKKNIKNLCKLIKLLDRKLLKNMIMTVGYSIGSKKAYVD